LIMVTLSMVSSFSSGGVLAGPRHPSTCGCFLRVEQSFSRMISIFFSLSSLWTASRANVSLCLCEWWRLHVLRVEGSPRLKNGGPNRPRVGQVGRPRPILARFGDPFTPVGPHVFMHFAPSICTILTMSSSRPRWRLFLHEVQSFTLQSSGMFLCNTLVLATFGSNFVKLSNRNETPQLLF
jgi:hypothetical protein